MKILILILAFTACFCAKFRAASKREEQFNDFLNKNSDIIITSQVALEFRQEVFNENMNEAEQLNEDPNQQATFGVTSLSGLTEAEFNKLKGLIPSTDAQTASNSKMKSRQLQEEAD